MCAGLVIIYIFGLRVERLLYTVHIDREKFLIDYVACDLSAEGPLFAANLRCFILDIHHAECNFSGANWLYIYKATAVAVYQKVRVKILINPRDNAVNNVALSPTYILRATAARACVSNCDIHYARAYLPAT